MRRFCLHNGIRSFAAVTTTVLSSLVVKVSVLSSLDPTCNRPKLEKSEQTAPHAIGGFPDYSTILVECIRCVTPITKTLIFSQELHQDLRRPWKISQVRGTTVHDSTSHFFHQPCRGEAICLGCRYMPSITQFLRDSPSVAESVCHHPEPTRAREIDRCRNDLLVYAIQCALCAALHIKEAYYRGSEEGKIDARRDGEKIVGDDLQAEEPLQRFGYFEKHGPIRLRSRTCRSNGIAA
jgi:hypothetical protein